MLAYKHYIHEVQGAQKDNFPSSHLHSRQLSRTYKCFPLINIHKFRLWDSSPLYLYMPYTCIDALTQPSGSPESNESHFYLPCKLDLLCWWKPELEN